MFLVGLYFTVILLFSVRFRRLRVRLCGDCSFVAFIYQIGILECFFRLFYLSSNFNARIWFIRLSGFLRIFCFLFYIDAFRFSLFSGFELKPFPLTCLFVVLFLFSTIWLSQIHHFGSINLKGIQADNHRNIVPPSSRSSSNYVALRFCDFNLGSNVRFITIFIFLKSLCVSIEISMSLNSS